MSRNQENTGDRLAHDAVAAAVTAVGTVAVSIAVLGEAPTVRVAAITTLVVMVSCATSVQVFRAERRVTRRLDGIAGHLDAVLQDRRRLEQAARQAIEVVRDGRADDREGSPPLRVVRDDGGRSGGAATRPSGRRDGARRDRRNPGGPRGGIGAL